MIPQNTAVYLIKNICIAGTAPPKKNYLSGIHLKNGIPPYRHRRNAIFSLTAMYGRDIRRASKGAVSVECTLLISQNNLSANVFFEKIDV